MAWNQSRGAEPTGGVPIRQFVPAGMPPMEVADAVFAALREDQFYILTHPEGREAVRTRIEDILQERNQTPPGPRRGGLSRSRSMILRRIVMGS